MDALQKAARQSAGLQPPKGATPALSFRLSDRHCERMRAMAERRDTSMTDLLRQWIDLTWEAEQEAKRRPS